MKKTLAILLPVLALLAAALWALAAGGADDPLASLSYLEGTFSDTVDRAVELEPDQRIKKALRKTCRHIDDLFAELEDLL